MTSPWFTKGAWPVPTGIGHPAGGCVTSRSVIISITVVVDSVLITNPSGARAMVLSEPFTLPFGVVGGFFLQHFGRT
jgi:hypothetical protein